jgi:hypothetical protein
MPCRSELARDGREDATGHQTPHVIVNDHRERARSYRGFVINCHPTARRALDIPRYNLDALFTSPTV